MKEKTDYKEGKLVLVPTPVGNLKDITFRAVEALQAADVVLCEDTRVTGMLLKHLGIEKKLYAHHQHNEHHAIKEIIRWLKEENKQVVLVSDAGTPAISDPGFLLVRACTQEQIAVECLPGPTAFVPALVVSGLPVDRFVFEGFLPPKKGRQTRLKELALEERTIVFYESPHRLEKTLDELIEHFGADRSLTVSREISKLFEETVRGSIEEVKAHFQEHPAKGEMVVCIAGNQ